MIFHKDKNILALATTQATARNLVTKTIFMYDQLPKWLKLTAVEKNKLSLRLKNGSRIQAKSSSSDAARSEEATLTRRATERSADSRLFESLGKGPYFPFFKTLL